MKNLLKALVCAGFILPASQVAAQVNDETGMYAGLDVGAAILGDVDVTYYDAGGTFGGTGSEDTVETTFDPSTAITFGGVIGYDFGTIRADLEVDYSKNNIDTITVNSVNGSAITLTPADRAEVCDYLEYPACAGSGNTFAVDGARLRQLSAMGNAWLDIPVGGIFTPYIGGGLGVTGFETDGEGKARFAWQVGAGAAVALGESVELTVDLRHRRVNDTVIVFDNASGVRIDDLKTNSITAGVRFRF